MSTSFAVSVLEKYKQNLALLGTVIWNSYIIEDYVGIIKKIQYNKEIYTSDIIKTVL